METITVGFSKPKTWKPFAWAIMTAYGIDYDHVYIKFHSDSLQRDVIYQASKSMINFMGTAVFESDNIVVKEFEVSITPENRIKLMQFAVDNAGKPYSLKEAAGFGIVVVCSWFGKKISNPFKAGTDEYVCSVLADYILENFTDKNAPGDFEDSDPRYLYEFLSKNQ